MSTFLQIATSAAALISFVLSVYLFATQHWAKRKADLGAWFEPSGKGASMYLLITNFGPHEADQIDASLKGRGKDNHPAGLQWQMRAGDPDFPIPRLHSGEHYAVYSFIETLNREPAEVHLSWHDGRRGPQRKVIQLSVRRVRT